ncbi:MAG: nicotinate-nucleotide--dimethylbenzimidazole phosphoribosyltransferase [Proteobacteria bacterium]|nr:nicotinate-nucleotide--dimethylbenzimidazole phosphoribosyltransferase [Pseudomonadota bacterium]MCP4922334.1 nicotinate-nucleotide--dimethylbenzimidazole phosphoribosyltransferase [Pseudomonadota bacterium]
MSFSEEERESVYRAIYTRRDIRAFRPDPVPDEVLWRILDAAHHAGSVGFMQPWNFVLIRDRPVREQLLEHFNEVSARAADLYDGDRRQKYMALKLQGILDAPLNVLITCDTRRGGPNVLGRSTIRETDVYSTCLAVQNFWLAARAEGVGAGWISILEPDYLRDLVGIPEHVIPIAYLTVGYPVEFPSTPMLERVGWRRREGLQDLVYDERWGAETDREAPPTEVAPTPRDEVVQATAARQAELTKPPGSLGQLEALGLQMAAIQGRATPRCQHRALVLLAGDHGVTVERVSAYKPEVTAKMVYQFVAGGGAVNALAREVGLDLHVVDVGVDHDFLGATGVLDHKVRRGTRNLRLEPAMTPEECARAVLAGRRVVESLDELDVLAVGEMGIGNSTAAAAICAALLGTDAAAMVGMGTGIGQTTLARKVEVVDDALALHTSREPLAVLASLGGLEIAGLVGAIQAARDRGALVVLDGFITGAAALVAVRDRAEIRQGLVAGHRSAEPGHRLVLDALGLRPLLDLDMRLGEGSGAVLAVKLVDAACRVLSDMATFEEAGMDHPLEPGGRS